MRTFRNATLVTLSLAVLLALPSLAASEWQTDFEAAKQLASKENKQLLLDFTGSDWCASCIKMRKETLSQKEFLEFADKSLVLVEVDFPISKRQRAAQKKANAALQEKYRVEMYPTFLLVDANGKELGRQDGYLQGGPPAFIARIEEWRKSAK